MIDGDVVTEFMLNAILLSSEFLYRLLPRSPLCGRCKWKRHHADASVVENTAAVLFYRLATYITIQIHHVYWCHSISIHHLCASSGRPDIGHGSFGYSGGTDVGGL